MLNRYFRFNISISPHWPPSPPHSPLGGRMCCGLFAPSPPPGEVGWGQTYIFHPPKDHVSPPERRSFAPRNLSFRTRNTYRSEPKQIHHARRDAACRVKPLKTCTLQELPHNRFSQPRWHKPPAP